MLKIVRASALIVALACAASAGEIPNNIAEAPTQPTATTTQEPTADADPRPEAADRFGENLLNLVYSVLALF